MMTCMLSVWTMGEAKMAVRLANTKYQLLLFAYYAYNIKPLVCLFILKIAE